MLRGDPHRVRAREGKDVGTRINRRSARADRLVCRSALWHALTQTASARRVRKASPGTTGGVRWPKPKRSRFPFACPTPCRPRRCDCWMQARLLSIKLSQTCGRSSICLPPKERVRALRTQMQDAGEDADAFMANVIEQACNRYLQTGEFPTTYEQLQPTPVLSVGLLTFAGDDGMKAGQIYRARIEESHFCDIQTRQEQQHASIA